MRLKKIVIMGFKSFADKTILHFDVGITCIVGPNGCGKSNIADAFRWVLGEQSAKSMRGTKMPDVIFAGTSQRKPLNYAEVSLTLTDVQDALPIEYQEVTVTRRLHRNGESEYLLNGNSVRLKDLQMLFLDSGMGRNAFSIFEQGKMDQVISNTPLERRIIFEEAAGILRFLQRKKEAIQKLEQADVNLSRVHDIHLEVEKLIAVLESQAQKAKIFKEQKALLEDLEKASYVLRWQSYEKKHVELTSKMAQQQNLMESCETEVGIFQKHCHNEKQLKQQNEKALRLQSEKILILKGEHEIQVRENLSLQKKLEEAQQRKKKLYQEREDLVLARQTRQQTLGELERERYQLELEWSEAESKLAMQQNRVKVQEKEVIRLRQEVGIKQHKHLKVMQQNGQWQSDLKQAEVRLENLTDYQKRVESQFLQSKKERDQLEKNIQERKKQLHEMSTQIDHHKKQLTNFEQNLKKVNQERERQQKDCDDIKRKMMESKARQKVLFRMREEYEGFSSGSKRLLQEAQQQNSPFYRIVRPFYEFFTPEEEAIEACAVVLRAYAQTLVVERAEDFKKILHYAEKIGLQDYSLMCMEFIKESNAFSHFSNGMLVDKVAPNLFTSHFLKSVAVEAETEHMMQSWKEGVIVEGWSSQGFFVDHLGVLFKVKPNENQVFLRESELRNLEEELANKDKLLAEVEISLQHLQQRRSSLQQERMELDKVLRRDEMKLVEVNFGLQRALADQEKNQKEQMSYEKDIIALTENFKNQRQNIQTLAEQFSHSKKELIQLQEEKEVLQEGLIKQETALCIQEQDQKEKGTRYRNLTDSKKNVLHQSQLLETKEQEYDKNKKRIEEELQGMEDIQAITLQAEVKVQGFLAELKTKMQEETSIYNALEKQEEEISKQSELAEQQYTWKSVEYKKISNEYTQIQLQSIQHETARQAIVEELSARYQITIDEALQSTLPLNRSLDQTEKQVKKLRQVIQEAGDVNLTAIEDLEKQQERNTFLKSQIDDMLQSKKELIAIIQQLDEESRKLFQSTFEAIRANFKKNFQILFNGGEADLQFTDTNDPLEAGIEISAKPPGKQLRAISLLSGGEKCLTAVALLFAIFEVKPAPFCILDEIDAPLDDANVERFTNVVKHFIDRCQFLIITHNKRTMAIGDVLYGVSMQERGVSKLLMLEFTKQAAPTACLIS